MCLHLSVPVGKPGTCPTCGAFACRYFDEGIEEHGDDPGPFDEECPDALEADREGEAMGAAVLALDLVRYVQVSGEAGGLEALAARTTGRRS